MVRKCLRFAVALLFAAAAAIAVSGARGAAGDLDPSFGTGGKVIADFGTVSRALGVAVQADGRVVAVGRAPLPAPPPFGRTVHFGVARFTLDGTLDGSFGSGGLVTTSFGGTSEEATAVAIQPDGRIVVAGNTTAPGTSRELFALARYNPDGSLDGSFGVGGKVVLDFSPSGAHLAALAVTSDGKIVVAGNTFPPQQAFALARFNADGGLDESFGIGGKLTTGFGTDFALARAVALQPNGKVVAAGSAGGGSTSFALARYNSDGSLDGSFGVGGKVTTSFGGFFATAAAVAVAADGHILAAGGSFGATASWALARFNSDGTLDGSFGVGGKVTSFAGAAATALAVEPDGKSIAAGFVSVGSSGDRDWALARYNADGTLDSSFGAGGLVTTDFGGVNDFASAVASTPDGKIVAAGEVTPGGFGLARYTLAVDTTPPVITPSVTGTLGLNGWYTSDILVSWMVSDPDSPVSAQSGCGATSVTADTAGLTLTCTATSAGGTSSHSVTIKRDATPPAMSCSANPSSLWPPNHKLRAVETSVGVSDALSGPGGSVLERTEADEGDPALDIVGWTLGEPDTSGFLRAERFGGERIYTLTYRGNDNAGNRQACEIAVIVPRDRRP